MTCEWQVLEFGGWNLRIELDAEESWKRPRVIIILPIFSEYRTKSTALPLHRPVSSV